ncbi:MAG: response regulator, partial [Saprospiraceae bacterium]
MKILVIEDEQGIADFIQQGLEEEGYAVDTANNGRKGLDWALNKAYDLLLVDWMLPGVMG